MPHTGTHITIVQRLALDPKLKALLGDPASVDDARMRYACLGALGPDMMYALLDYNSTWTGLESHAVRFIGTFRSLERLQEVSDQINAKIGSAVDTVTCGAGSTIDRIHKELIEPLKTTLATLGQLLVVAGSSAKDPYPGFRLRRQDDKPRKTWFWADYLHYVRTGDFAAHLIALSKSPKYAAHPNLHAYALGYLTHYVADVVGHPYVNQIVQAPYRLYWQRHGLVENFIDSYVWDRWHDPAPAAKGGKKQAPDGVRIVPGGKIGGGASYTRARLHQLIDIGGPVGIDPIDAYLDKAAAEATKPVIGLGLASEIKKPDDAEFKLWTQMFRDALVAAYKSDHPINLKDGFPTTDEIAAAYTLMRLYFRLSTSQGVKKPVFPDLGASAQKFFEDLGNGIAGLLDGIPPPPSMKGKLSAKSFWKKLKEWAEWIVDAAIAVAENVADILKDLCKNAGEIAVDIVKAAMYPLQMAMFAAYDAIRSILVQRALATPHNTDLQDEIGDFKARNLWVSRGSMSSGEYPVEEFVDENNKSPQQGDTDDYVPLVPPNSVPGAKVELNPIVFAAPYGPNSTPDVFLEPDKGPDNLFDRLKGPQKAIPHPPSPNVFVLESFEATPKNFGGALANCRSGIAAVSEILAKNVNPVDKLKNMLPNYNLDGDRGYAWPCWDVASDNVILNPKKIASKQAAVSAVKLD